MNNEHINKIKIAGEISTIPQKYTVKNNEFWSFTLAVKRYSKATDELKVTLPVKLKKSIEIGEKICIIGEIRTYWKKHENGKDSLTMVVFARDLEEYIEDENSVLTSGVVCKPPVYRVTPLGSRICDVTLAVNRKYGSSYIPCVFWNNCAETAKSYYVGETVKINGRLQSRNYEKVIGDTVQNKVAYELSVMSIETDSE